MRKLQAFIYHLEEGIGKYWGRVAAAVLALLLIALAYNWFCFRNMATQEAMDCAQIARNISEGNGFSTRFIRPLSIRLLQERASADRTSSGALESGDPARLRTMHPDISNAPLYPMLLAGLMKILPFDFQIDLDHRFWSTTASGQSMDFESASSSRVFRRYQPDFLISAF